MVDSELTGLLRSALVLALLPSIVLLLVAPLVRWRPIAVALVVPVIGFAIAYGAFLISRGVAGKATTDRPPFGFLTWNLQHERADLDELAETIREADADVVAVQELSVTASDYLAEALRDSYPHQVLNPNPHDRAGTGHMTARLL